MRSRKVWARSSTAHIRKNVQNRLTPEILTNNHAKRREKGMIRRTELVRCLWYFSANSALRKGLSTRSTSGKIEAETPAIVPHFPVSLLKPVFAIMYPARACVVVSI